MIKTYQYYSSALKCNIFISYDDGVICKVEAENPDIDFVMSERIANDRKASFFVYEVGFLEATKGKIAVKEITRIIPFDAFWDKYNYKTSGRIDAEKAWNKLSVADKIGAYDYIPRYEAMIKLSNVAKMYGSRYLNAKRWIK